jgi:hypothetical protein
MKNMLIFKQIEFSGQCLLWLLALIGAINDTWALMIIYMILGPWQIFSLLLHFPLYSYYYVGRWRKWYITSLVVYVFLAVISSALDEGDGYSTWIIMGLSPLLAIMYTIACYQEIKILSKKIWVHQR